MEKILIIDDDEIVRVALAKLLEYNDFEVGVAVNGNDGIQEYESTNYDLVITDIFMPEKDGIETIMYLREKYPAIKIIAITGVKSLPIDNPDDWAQHFGADRLFMKPFRNDELVQTIRQLL